MYMYGRKVVIKFRAVYDESTNEVLPCVIKKKVYIVVVVVFCIVLYAVFIFVFG